MFAQALGQPNKLKIDRTCSDLKGALLKACWVKCARLLDVVGLNSGVTNGQRHHGTVEARLSLEHFENRFKKI